MNGWLLASGLVAAATAVIHVGAGGRDVVRPLLDSGLAAESKRTLHAVWHLVTADLVLGAAVLLFLGFRTEPNSALVLFISAQYLAYTAVFVVITLTTGWSRALVRLPQWMLLLPVGILAAVGAV